MNAYGMTFPGMYKNGRIVLERPPAQMDGATVLVTFVPAGADMDALKLQEAALTPMWDNPVEDQYGEI